MINYIEYAEHKLLNLTQDEIIIHIPEGQIIIPPSGMIASCETQYSTFFKIGEISVYQEMSGHAEGLPSPLPDTFYVVTPQVMMATDRKDVVAPGEPLFDENGNFVGYDGLFLGRFGVRHDPQEPYPSDNADDIIF